MGNESDKFTNLNFIIEKFCFARCMEISLSEVKLISILCDDDEFWKIIKLLIFRAFVVRSLPRKLAHQISIQNSKWKYEMWNRFSVVLWNLEDERNIL